MNRRHKTIPLCVFLSTVLCMSINAGEYPEQERGFRDKLLKDLKGHSLSASPGHARMLQILVATGRAQRGIEVGSGYGYGAIHMGIAFERNGGHLYTLEIDPERAKACRENINRSRLGQTVTCIQGDALETIAKLKGEFDFVFIDAAKQDTLKYFRCLEPKLKPGAVVVANCAIVNARVMEDYLRLMESSVHYDTVIIKTSPADAQGMAISYRIP